MRESLLIILCGLGMALADKKPVKDNHFDFYLFTQIWPAADCSVWKSMGAGNKCTQFGDEWTVHGIWPTRKDEEKPVFCNNSVHFNPDKIKDLLPQLRLKWTNVRENKNEYDFWKHEFEKHGTCMLDKFNEHDYFKKGLELNDKYSIRHILDKASVTPGYSYKPQDVYDILKTDFRVDSLTMECKYDVDTESHYFYQIGLCMSKDFTLINCDDVASEHIMNCPKNLMYYPSASGVNVLAVITVIIILILIGVMIFFAFRKYKAYVRRAEYNDLLSQT